VHLRSESWRSAGRDESCSKNREIPGAPPRAVLNRGGIGTARCCHSGSRIDRRRVAREREQAKREASSQGRKPVYEDQPIRCCGYPFAPVHWLSASRNPSPKMGTGGLR